MIERHAQRIAAAFGRVFRNPGTVERKAGNVYRVRLVVEGVPLVFDDADDAIEFLCARWWR